MSFVYINKVRQESSRQCIICGESFNFNMNKATIDVATTLIPELVISLFLSSTRLTSFQSDFQSVTMCG